MTREKKKWNEYVTIVVNRNLSNCEKARKKDFGASTGFEPVASALALQCSTSLSYEDPYTGGRSIYWEKETVYFSQAGTDFRQIHVILALFMFKRQSNIIFKALHVSQWFDLNFSSETARFETFVNISSGGSTEPPLVPPLDCRWLLQFRCVPASHQFLGNFA